MRTAKTDVAPRRRTDSALDGIGGQIPLPIPVPDWSKPIILALLLLAFWLGVRASVAKARARRLERQRARLLRDVGAMQAALAPDVPSQLGGLDVSVAYHPAEGPAAGGDFYDLFVPQPGKVAIMLGDVSGHGHEALTHAALTRYTLRAYLQAGLEPRTALALAGRVLADPSGGRYATVALALFEQASGRLTYALAGHPPPMLLGPSEVEPVTACSSPPVGWGMPTGRRQTSLTLAAGSEVCFFSDGLIEARHDGQLLGRDQLREILRSMGSQPVAEELLEEVRSTAEDTPDDMVACIVSPQARASSRRVHVEELEVDASMLARPGVARFLRECDLTPAHIAHALKLVDEAVASAGGALVRVEHGPAGVQVSVTPSESDLPGTAPSGAQNKQLAGDAELVAADSRGARAVA